MSDRPVPPGPSSPDQPAPADQPAPPDPADQPAPPDPADQPAPPDGPAPVDDAAEQPAAGTPPPAEAAAAPRRFSAAGVVVALLLGLLGFTLVVQVRNVATDPTLAAARQDDLVRILADLDTHEERLREDLAGLEETRRRLTTAGQSQQEALAEAARRADELGILAGTLPAVGPGLVVDIREGAEPVSAATLLDAVQELRGAGAEAMQLAGRDGPRVRVVASTYFVDAEGGIRVDGQVLRSPYRVTVIGDPDTLRPALHIPRGVVDSVHRLGGTVTVQDVPDGVEISVVRAPSPLRFAQPVSEPEG